jgi:hypothetical protein
LRARQAAAMNDLLIRIRQSVLVQEGDNPPEEPWKLIDEYCELSGEHATLITRIMQTNLNTIIYHETDGDRIIDLLQEREVLVRERNMYRQAVQWASGHARFGRQEIKYVPQINIGEVRQKERNVTREITDLDVRIQSINWSTDLEE